MRAVNLIPADARVGGGRSAGHSGGAAYALLGGLAALVLLVALWATASGRIADQKAELAQVQQEVAQVQARAAALQSPGATQQARLTRTALVKTLAAQRIDWAERIDALSRALPADVTLEKLDATSAGAGPAVATTAVAGPVAHLTGCAPSQRAVALLMPRLRSVPEVTRVTLLSASTSAAGSGAQTTGEADSCAGASFSMDLLYEAATPAAPVTGAPAPEAVATAAPGAATTAVQGTPDPGTGGTR